MKYPKHAKRKLFTSFLCILLCISMLLGSTYAWFTDRVSTKNNIITSGNLDLEMYWTDDPSTGVWNNVEEDAYNTIFSYDNWEPGYTDVKYIKIVNKGDLALNYDLSIEAQGAVGKLAEVINVYYAVNDDKLNLRSDLDQLSAIGLLSNVMNGGSQASGTLLPAGTTSLFHNSGEVIVTLAMQMVTTAGNEYQNESSGEFTIKALATQAPWERDSFGSDYDSTAEMPFALVPTNITVPVTPTAEGTVGAEGLQIVGPNAAAYLPEGVKLADGATEVTFSVIPNDSAKSGMSAVNDEFIIPMDVSIAGVAEDNDVPIVIDLGPIMPKYLNMGNYGLIHVEDGVNEIMTQVANRDALVAHNQFTYDSNTGAVSVALMNFSPLDLIVNTANPWQGGVDFSWFTTWKPGPSSDNQNRRIYTLTNGDQLNGFSRLLGGMLTPEQRAKIPETCTIEGETYNTFTYVSNEGKTIDILAMGFNGHTVQLLNDVDMDGGNHTIDGQKVIFYPIGYYNNTIPGADPDTTHPAPTTQDGTSPAPMIFDRTDGDPVGLKNVYSNFKAFRGTFNGNGHTIRNIYQNTWEMFGDYNNGYTGTPNYYKDGMGLFGWLYGATIYNTNIDNFQSDGEFTPTGIIAAYAEAAHDADNKDYGSTTIQGVSITNSNPRVYNTGNGGIVGIGGRTDTPAAYDECSTCKLIFRNITVDQSNKISALWGSWDVGCGGIMGMFRGYGNVEFYNCHVAAQIDVFNDVCGNYQYYWYRYAGMMIGTIYDDYVDDEGYTVPYTDNIKAEACSVRFDDWNDYYYCELVDNSLASYTHDHQMSRLVEVAKVEGTTITPLSGEPFTVPSSGRANYVVALPGERSTENAECYHFKDGKVWTHDMGGIDEGIDEDQDGNDDLKEDKQHIYLPFNQLFQGYGWGVKHIPIYEDNGFPGITIMKAEDFSKEKFTAKYTTSESDPLKVGAGATIKAGDLFTAIGEIDTATVAVFVEKILADETYERIAIGSTGSWFNRTIKLADGENAYYRVSIQDFKYCKPTVMYLEAVTQTKEADCEHCQMSVTWKPWYPGALPTGHYYLVEDVTAYAPITVAAGADAVLDLSGKTMTFPESAAVDVGEGRTFSIVDSSEDNTGAMVGFGDEDGVLKVSGGTLNLYEGNFSYPQDAMTLAEDDSDDDAQVSTKGIIWAANPETTTGSAKTKVLFTENVTIPATAQIFLAAEAVMEIHGSVNSDKIPLVELETNALLNIQNMTGDAGKPIEIMANGEFAYITGAELGQTDRMNQAKTWFKAADGYTAITIQAKSLFTQIDLTEAIKAGFQRGQTVAAATADMSQLIENKTCPMCGKTNVTWVKYNSASHALVQGGSQLHLYLDSTNCGSKENPIKGGNFIGSYKGDTDICVMLMDGAKVYTNGRFLVNPDNTLNIMGNGSVHSYGTSGLGMFTILGKNTTVNLFGGTYTYAGDYTANGKTEDPAYALIYTSSKHSVVNIYNNATIGYTAAEIEELSPEKKANYNVNLNGTLNMYGGTIRNGISANEWHSGNVTVQGSGVLNMYDGEITGGQTNYRGGNVLLHSLSTMNMGYRDTIDGVNMTPVVRNGTALYSKNVYDTADAAAQAKLDEKKANGEVAEDATITAVDRIPGGGNIGTKGFVGYMTFNMYTGTITNGKTIPGDDDYSVNNYMRFYMGGGNLYLSGAYSNNALVAGSISGGEAYSGGNIYIRNGVKLTLKSTARVENGKAIVTNGDIGGQGGNINVFHGAIMTMEGGLVTGGKARIGGNINIGETAGEDPYVKILAGEVSNGEATQNGGNIHIAGLSQLDITGGTFSDCTAVNGGNIYATGTDKTDDNKNVIGTNKPVVNISGGTFRDSSATNYGGNFCVSNGTMNIAGGTLNGGYAPRGGNIYASQSAVVNITDGQINGDTSGNILYGGNIFAIKSAQLNISGGTIQDGKVVNEGGNIHLTDNAQATVSGNAQIQGGSAITTDKKSGKGGNINVGAGASLTVSGGTITGGYSRLGGNIAVGESNGARATANITGGIIENGDAYTNGGNLLVAYDAVVDMSNGKIYGGKISEAGSSNKGINIYVGLVNDVNKVPTLTISGGNISGGLYVGYSTSLNVSSIVNLSGAPIIKNDAVENGTGVPGTNGVYIAVNATIDVSDLTNGAKIDIDCASTGNEVTFTGEYQNASTVLNCFQSVKANYIVALENNVLKLVKQ